MSLSSGNAMTSAARSAASSALTGPLPSATVISLRPATSTLMVASESVTRSPRAFQRRSSSTRKLCSLKYSGTVSSARLDLFEEGAELRMIGRDFDADLAQPRQEVGPARLVRDDDMPAVADDGRIDMLVGARILLHRRDMEAALMREGAFADIGGVAVGRAVEALVEEAREMRQARQAGGVDARRIAHLEDQVRHDRDQIGVAAALAQPVERALDVARAAAHRRQRIGDAGLGVVVAMDADFLPRHGFRRRTHDALDFGWQGPAVGIAQHDPARAGFERGGDAIEREFRIGLVAVEAVSYTHL